MRKFKSVCLSVWIHACVRVCDFLEVAPDGFLCFLERYPVRNSHLGAIGSRCGLSGVRGWGGDPEEDTGEMGFWWSCFSFTLEFFQDCSPGFKSLFNRPQLGSRSVHVNFLTERSRIGI